MNCIKQLVLITLLISPWFLTACRHHTIQDPFTVSNCTSTDTLDYGDAPDGTPTGYTVPGAPTGIFPSSTANSGVTANINCNYWIGEFVSGEGGYNDPLDPDPLRLNSNPPGSNIPNMTTDYDDGVGYEWRPAANPTPDRLPAELIFNIQINSIGVHEVVFNILVDANRDGDWDADSGMQPGGEWGVRNHVQHIRNGFGTYEMPPIQFPIESSGMPECMWARVLLSDRPVEYGPKYGWSGRGSFNEGEIEDILVIGANGSACLVLQPEN